VTPNPNCWSHWSVVCYSQPYGLLRENREVRDVYEQVDAACSMPTVDFLYLGYTGTGTKYCGEQQCIERLYPSRWTIFDIRTSTALQTLREHDQESWVLFVDLVKAYDTVNREMLWKILTTLGVPESLITVLKKLYKDVTTNLRVGEKLEQFLSTSGVKQGDNLAPVLFICVIHAVSNSLDKKWEFTTPDFRWFPNTQGGKPRGQLRGTNHNNKGTMFSFFKSYYVDDTAFILLSRGEVIAASKLIVSHFRRFGLTIHTGSKRKKRRLEN
jgi:hypothetical protein